MLKVEPWIRPPWPYYHNALKKTGASLIKVKFREIFQSFRAAYNIKVILINIHNFIGNNYLGILVRDFYFQLKKELNVG